MNLRASELRFQEFRHNRSLLLLKLNEPSTHVRTEVYREVKVIMFMLVTAIYAISLSATTHESFDAKLHVCYAADGGGINAFHE